MSIGGPSPLGTLLIQRLDAVLGHTVGQQANLVTGARADAVSQSPQPERNQPVHNSPVRHPREVVDQLKQHQGQSQQAQVRHSQSLDNRQAAIEALLRHTSTSATPSAPTTLGRAARTILEIIERFPDGTKPLVGQRPLVDGIQLQQLGQQLQAAQRGGSASQSNLSEQNALTRASTSASAGAPNPAANPNVQTSASTQQTLSPSHQVLNALVQLFTQGLRSTVQQSGMFYESQLARFSFGQHSELQLLQQQPQNQLASQTAADAASSQQNQSKTASPSTHSSAQHASHPTPTLTEPELAHQGLIRQQLEVLAAQQFLWRGEVWPHAPLEWMVQREQEHEGTASHQPNTPSEQWRSTLRMHLGGLGDIEFDISLQDKQLALHIRAADTAATLQPHLQQLNERLEEHGLHIKQLNLSNLLPSTSGPSTSHD
ncbi:MAG TPA: flagellar hook-length control protein FliK [Paenalcaligenes sp.]|nr:flagellar hook-length control protein FliK [Paenalcaligenes sp.]